MKLEKMTCKTGPDKWRIRFNDRYGARRRLVAFTHERPSRELGEKIDRLVGAVVADEMLDADLRKWLEGLPSRIRTRLDDLDLQNLLLACPNLTHLFLAES